MKKKSIILRVLAFGVCVYMIVTIAGLWRDLAKAQEEKNTLLAEKDQLTNEIDELKEILADDSHTALIKIAEDEYAICDFMENRKYSIKA